MKYLLDFFMISIIFSPSKYSVRLAKVEIKYVNKIVMDRFIRLYSKLIVTEK